MFLGYRESKVKIQLLNPKLQLESKQRKFIVVFFMQTKPCPATART